MALGTTGNLPTKRRRRINRWREYDRALVHRRVSWQALLAGLVITIAVELLLSTLGAGVGLSFIHHHASDTPDVNTFSAGAGLWWLISNLIALLIGGYISARMAGVTVRYDGALHGLVTWGLATLLTVYLLTTAAGGLMGGAFNIIGNTVDAAGSGLKAIAAPALQKTAGNPGSANALSAYLQPGGTNPANMSPKQAQAAIAAELPVYEAGGSGAPAAKQKIIAIMAAQMNVSQQKATDRFNSLQAKAEAYKKQTIRDAKRLAASSAHDASTAAYLTFGMLILGALFGTIGGALAAPRSTLVAETETEAT